MASLEKIYQQGIAILVAVGTGQAALAVGYVGKEVANLGIDGGIAFALDHRTETLDVAVVEAGHEHSIQAIQMANKIPKAGLAIEATVDWKDRG